MKTIRDQLTGKCRHFTGLLGASEDDSVACKAGVAYYDLMKIDEFGSSGCMCRVPCLGGKPGDYKNGYEIEFCGEFEPNTEQDIQDRINSIEQTTMAMQNNISPCCYAELDKSEVIQEGPNAGHGPRFCSKCKKVAYIV